MHRPLLPTVEEVCRNARRVAVLEGIVDSTNIGAIFRSAAALNMDAVLVTPSCCDPLCRRAVRVSMGTVFQVPWTQIGSTAADWPEQGMQQLHTLGFKTAAMALTDAVARYVPGVLGSDESTEEESFSAGLLEYPQYTRPAVYKGLSVPEVLLSGNHEKVEKWRREQSLEITRKNRPDLLK